MSSHSGAPGMVRMTCLGLFAIDCDDLELGCTLFLKAASFGGILPPPRPNLVEYLPLTLELKNATRHQPIE